MTKYLNLDITKGAAFSFRDLHGAIDGAFPRKLNSDEAFRLLEEDCRPLGLQPEYYFGSIRIVSASKKFMKRERRYNQPLSKRTLEYINFRAGIKED